MFFSKEAPISFIFFAITIGISILLYLDYIEVYDIYFHKEFIFKNHEYWRLITPFFYFGSMGYQAIVQMAFFFNSVISAEKDYFNKKPADFILFNLIGMTAIWVVSYFLPFIFLAQGLTSYYMYYTVKKSPDQMMIMFILPIPIRAPYIPLMYLALELLIGKNYIAAIIHIVGYLTAHLYFFVHDILNLSYDVELLACPDFMNNGLNKFFNLFSYIYN